MEEMTLNTWYEFWITNLIGYTRPSTVISYKSKYNSWIGPSIGDLRMDTIKPYHCMMVLNSMRTAGRKDSTIGQVKGVMNSIFLSAVENDIIVKNPVTKFAKQQNSFNTFRDTRFLTRDEQRLFLNEARRRQYYEQFAFILQTGIRYGELTGLKWSDIDFEHSVMHIVRSASYLEEKGELVVGPPKSANGYRYIYLTDEAIDILRRIKRTSEFIFVDKKGRAIKRSNYNTQLKRICGRIGIEPFSIHKLRHTFATRCIEAGMKPKTLQRILGHSSITTTLNYYVHITDSELASEMEKFESLKI